MDKVIAIMEERSIAAEKIAASLAHMSLKQTIYIVLCYIRREDLERVVSGICGDDDARAS